MNIDVLKGIFFGRTIACVASGPSLTKEKIKFIKDNFEVVLVCNSAFRDFPDAKLLFSYDHEWYRLNFEEIKKTFHGARFCKDLATETCGYAYSLQHQKWFEQFGNSGATLLHIALHTDPDEIYLFGYDLKVTDKTHYHGDHPAPLGNCNRIEHWQDDFDRVFEKNEKQILKINIVNVNENSALNLFNEISFENLAVEMEE